VKVAHLAVVAIVRWLVRLPRQCRLLNLPNPTCLRKSRMTCRFKLLTSNFNNKQFSYAKNRSHSYS
jgi:hypothetical protein